MTFKLPDNPIEIAYRRGAHQAIAMVDSIIHEHLQVDPASVLDVARSEAGTLRREIKFDGFFCDELRNRTIAKLKEAGLLDE